MALRYVADKSALARMRHASVATRLGPLIIGGEVATCGVIDLELLFSARTHVEVLAVLAERATLPQLETVQRDFERAAQVLEMLARTGHHRAAGIPELLIAAIAERHRLAVLHYDRDFDVIAKVTKQRVEWIVPSGTVP